MPVTAVVFDIGSVLEVIEDAVFPEPFLARHGIAREAFDAACDFPGDPAVGEMTEAEIRAHWQQRLGLSDSQSDELMADQWTWYVGTIDEPLLNWYAGLRERGYRTGILSNSGPGAREAERKWGFEELADVIVYSHEVGLKKPDPRIYALTTERLGVPPEQVAFLDDWTPAVEAARAAGWNVVQHVDTPSSVAALETLLAQ